MKLVDILFEAKVLVVTVKEMSDANKGELKSKVKDLDRASDEYEEIAKNFCIDVLTNNGYVKKGKSTDYTGTANDLIIALESGSSSIEMPSMNQFDIVMIAGMQTYLKIGSGIDSIYVEINKK